MNHAKQKLVYLTGFMGSGKSTIAPVLAQRLDYGLIDTDNEIEIRAGQTVSEIFRTHGETYFRALERDVLHAVAQREGCVISLGGGTVTNVENLRVVKSSGMLVYLKASPEQILRRARLRTDRPLLEAIDGSRLNDADLDARVRFLLNSREPFYEQADVTILAEEKRLDSTVEEILNCIRELTA